MTRPVLTSPFNPSGRKALVCAEMAARTAGDGGPELAHVLFLADAVHVARHGRPLYGETWIRDADDGRVVRGVILSALTGRERRNIPYEVTEEDLSDWLSLSDVAAIREACARLREGTPSDVLRATPLHGAASEGVVDYTAALPAHLTDEEACDEVWMLARAAF